MKKQSPKRNLSSLTPADFLPKPPVTIPVPLLEQLHTEIATYSATLYTALEDFQERVTQAGSIFLQRVKG